MARTVIMDHPLIQHKIGIIRKKDTSSKEFREMISEIAMLMCYEATRELPLTDVEIETPICKTTVKELEGKKMAVVPILRAGLGMVEGMLAMIPAAKIGHIGLYRDPETLAPVEYYCKLPSDIASREVFVTDPMLATGGSATAAITMLKEKGAKKIHFMCIIASPEGIEKMHEIHPDVDVFVDPVSGRIAKQLYPKADITVGGFETTDRRDFFDLAIGNVPFGQYQVNDKAYNKLNFSIHNYFFAKALDQVRPGGVVAFVTSRYTMDAKDSTVRRYLAQRAELLGAIRLPNDAFKKNAGAEVVSDIIFLQKRDRPLDIAPEWTQTGIIRVPAKSQDFVGEGGATEQASFSPQGGNEQAQSATTQDGFAINRYFIDHPEMVLGRQEPVSTAHGMDYTVNPIEGLELSDQLHDAVKYIHGTYQEAELPELGEGEAIDTSIPADPNVKNYSYAIVDGQVYYRENSRMVRPDLNATAEARVKGLVGLRDCVQELIDLQMDVAVPDSTITQKQAELNRLYDSFSARKFCSGISLIFVSQLS